MKTIYIRKAVETVPSLRSFLINTGINPGVNEKIKQFLAVLTAYFHSCTPLNYFAHNHFAFGVNKLFLV